MAAAAILAMCLSLGGSFRAGSAVPERISVLPVFFVPRGEPLPTAEQSARLMRHMRWCQVRYRELLRGDTFSLAASTAEVYRGERDLTFYKNQPQGAAPDFVGELLKSKHLDRYNCPFIFVIVVMSPESDWIGGGARPFNGGNNLGGGLFEMTSYGLDHAPNVQSTIRHEIGHGLGLPHVDVYGQSMDSHRSMMSYNPGHLTNGFEDSRTPGEFSPEDLRALGMNTRCLKTFRFDPAKDIPAGESISPDIVCLGPMEIVGQPPFDPERVKPVNDNPQTQQTPEVEKAANRKASHLFSRKNLRHGRRKYRLI